jgi:molybdenum cofactor cytidylyltransferase
MGDTIAAAVQATPQAAAWLVLPADLPLIRPQTLVALAHLPTQASMVVPQFQGQRGHPVRFASACKDALSALRGSPGAAGLAASFSVLQWPVDDPGCVLDLDTMADLQTIRQVWRANAAEGV